MAHIMISPIHAIDLDKISDDTYQTALRVGLDTMLSTNRVAKSIKTEVEAARFIVPFKSGQ